MNIFSLYKTSFHKWVYYRFMMKMVMMLLLNHCMSLSLEFQRDIFWEQTINQLQEHLLMRCLLLLFIRMLLQLQVFMLSHLAGRLRFCKQLCKRLN